MKLTHVVALSVLLCLVAVAISPAALAATDITVTVDGEDVSDGDTVEVDDSPATVSFNVSSDTGISLVETEYGTNLDAEGLEARRSYRSRFNVSVFGQKEVSIQATDTGSETQSFRFTLKRSSETSTGLREDLQNIQDRANRLENETSELEERRQELIERREELRKQIENTTQGANNGSGNGDEDGNDDGNSSDGTGGGGQGLPGFTAVVALVAVAISVAALSLRKRS